LASTRPKAAASALPTSSRASRRSRFASRPLKATGHVDRDLGLGDVAVPVPVGGLEVHARRRVVDLLGGGGTG
jgi:hypothetical protein